MDSVEKFATLDNNNNKVMTKIQKPINIPARQEQRKVNINAITQQYQNQIENDKGKSKDDSQINQNMPFKDEINEIIEREKIQNRILNAQLNNSVKKNIVRQEYNPQKHPNQYQHAMQQHAIQKQHAMQQQPQHAMQHAMQHQQHTEYKYSIDELKEYIKTENETQLHKMLTHFDIIQNENMKKIMEENLKVIKKLRTEMRDTNKLYGNIDGTWV